MAVDPRSLVRTHFEQSLRDYWQQHYIKYQQGVEDSKQFLEEYQVPRESIRSAETQLPQSVRQAFDYYLGTVEAQDWGSVRLFCVPIAGLQVYAVRVTTDGDDGWLELYDEQGTELGAGRTYLELVAWGEREAIRAMVEGSTFPPELDDRSERTLWGK